MGGIFLGSLRLEREAEERVNCGSESRMNSLSSLYSFYALFSVLWLGRRVNQIMAGKLHALAYTRHSFPLELESERLCILAVSFVNFTVQKPTKKGLYFENPREVHLVAGDS